MFYNTHLWCKQAGITNCNDMLNQLRSHFKGLAANILLALLVLTFAVWGIGDMLRSHGGNQELASIGEVDISLPEFQHSLQREKENLQRSLGKQYSPELLKSMKLPERVLEQMIQRSLLLQEAQALGLRPADSDIAQMIQSNNAFHDDKGHFSKELFQSRLKNAGMNEKMYVDQLRSQVILEMIIGTISGHSLVHDEAVRTLFLSRNQERNVDLYLMNESLVQSVPAPKEDDIKAFYDANPVLFSTPEYRTLSYVRFTSNDLKDVKVTPQDVEAAYKERMDEFRQDERRTVQQLLFSSEDKAKKAYKMAKAGKSFADIAAKLDATNKKTLSLGSIPRDGLFDAAADAVFAMKEKDISEPVNSPFGWHVFRVDAIIPPGVRPLDEVRANLEKELKQTRVEGATDRMANDLEDALAGGSTLGEAAEKLGLALHTLPPVDTQGISPHGVKVQIPELDGFLDAAFKLDEKSESNLRTAADGAYYVVRADKITPARLSPLAEVKGEVVTAWKKDQQMKKLEALADKMSKDLANPKTRLSVANNNGLRVVNASSVKLASDTVAGYRLPPIMMAETFVRAQGDVTKAYWLEDGSFAIAAVSAIKQATIMKDDTRQKQAIAFISEKLAEQSRQELQEQYLQYLQQKYPVHINQSALSAAQQEE